MEASDITKKPHIAETLIISVVITTCILLAAIPLYMIATGQVDTPITPQPELVGPPAP